VAAVVLFFGDRKPFETFFVIVSSGAIAVRRLETTLLVLVTSRNVPDQIQACLGIFGSCILVPRATPHRRLNHRLNRSAMFSTIVEVSGNPRMSQY